MHRRIALKIEAWEIGGALATVTHRRPGTHPGSSCRSPLIPGRSGRAITRLPALARFAPRFLVLDLADQVSTHLR